jgi:hypothetical protein
MFLRSVVVSAVGINFENVGSNPALPASQILLVPGGFPAGEIDVHGCQTTSTGGAGTPKIPAPPVEASSPSHRCLRV